ncbi:MAG: ATP-dependent protease subunit HslV [Deltaproteobacteria bacterium]|nr:ATP-dependent protease subunit HslV [Deltaproteobacteria bacterium]
MGSISIRGTTILCLSHNGETVMAGDGQVTMGETVIKSSAKKVRTLYGGNILAGFAGSTADAFTLFERFENKLEKFSGNLVRSAVELAKDWRTDRMLRRLEALLIVADKSFQFIVSGSGDVIEPDEGVSAVGSGGPYAKAAALALKKHSSLNAEEIVREAMEVASKLCIYTNTSLTLEKIVSRSS